MFLFRIADFLLVFLQSFCLFIYLSDCMSFVFFSFLLCQLLHSYEQYVLVRYEFYCTNLEFFLNYRLSIDSIKLPNRFVDKEKSLNSLDRKRIILGVSLGKIIISQLYNTIIVKSNNQRIIRDFFCMLYTLFN